MKVRVEFECEACGAIEGGNEWWGRAHFGKQIEPPSGWRIVGDLSFCPKHRITVSEMEPGTSFPGIVIFKQKMANPAAMMLAIEAALETLKPGEKLNTKTLAKVRRILQFGSSN